MLGGGSFQPPESQLPWPENYMPASGQEIVEYVPDPSRLLEWSQWNCLEEIRKRDYQKATFIVENEKKKGQELQNNLTNMENRQTELTEEYQFLENQITDRQKKLDLLKVEKRDLQGQFDDMKGFINDLARRKNQLEKDCPWLADWGPLQPANLESISIEKENLINEQKQIYWKKSNLQQKMSLHSRESANRRNKIAEQNEQIQQLKAENEHLWRLQSLFRKS